MTERSKVGESEKLTINIGYVDLGQIDLLVLDRLYANRTDFIRTAIRGLLDRQSDILRHSRARRDLELGLREVTRAELEAARSKGLKIAIRVIGLAVIAADVSPELARAVIEHVSVLGALHASPGVRAALQDRLE